MGNTATEKLERSKLSRWGLKTIKRWHMYIYIYIYICIYINLHMWCIYICLYIVYLGLNLWLGVIAIRIIAGVQKDPMIMTEQLLIYPLSQMWEYCTFHSHLGGFTITWKRMSVMKRIKCVVSVAGPLCAVTLRKSIFSCSWPAPIHFKAATDLYIVWA